jgi:hypothetical protein
MREGERGKKSGRAIECGKDRREKDRVEREVKEIRNGERGLGRGRKGKMWTMRHIRVS